MNERLNADWESQRSLHHRFPGRAVTIEGRPNSGERNVRSGPDAEFWRVIFGGGPLAHLPFEDRRVGIDADYRVGRRDTDQLPAK